ncbi:ribonuclease H-like domain-containing protein [Amylocarpus encephaloides]|uniref:Ribonuclease H-like domain-containing protein n=1 Tax=Amylocarpus encephaloides TaxID=45428 RepID=A0A9P7YIE2_9HELO|nr:ribonuclease H-like domain-containing protein [Amylocarpus encephaloides]
MAFICVPCGRSFAKLIDRTEHEENSTQHRNLVERQFQASTHETGVKRPPAMTNSRTQDQTLKTKVTSQEMDTRWSEIPESEYHLALEALLAHSHSTEELEKHGIVVRLYDPEIYSKSRKCKRCCVHEGSSKIMRCSFHTSKRNKWNLNRPYKCCKMKDATGCQTLPAHDFQVPYRAMMHQEFQNTPAASALKRCAAVTLDCEMVGLAEGAREAIFVCVTDYLTGAILINRIVNPMEPIMQWCTNLHGISKAMLADAVAQGEALSGWEGAREELWKYIDEETIIVGHGLRNDLDVLRIIHPRIVDSAILSGKAVGVNRTWGLKQLCSELLGFEIRQSRGGVHDCLEDVRTTREVVLFCTRNADAVKEWAIPKREEEMRKQEERRVEQERKRELVGIEKQKEN